MIGSMVLVLALLGALLYVLKRMQAKVGPQSSGRRMKLLESLSLNSRHKVALLNVDGHTVVVGLSPAQSAEQAEGEHAQADAREKQGRFHCRPG